MNKLIIALACAGMATAGTTTVPASAQAYYDGDGFHQRHQNDGDGYDRDTYEHNGRYNDLQQRESQRRRDQYELRAHFERYDQRDGYAGYYREQDYADRGSYHRQQSYYQVERCASGTREPSLAPWQEDCWGVRSDAAENIIDQAPQA